MACPPLVSIVTIFLDAEEFLGEAIESVLAQSYDRWELLLVDDGSTDASTEIARAYERESRGKIRYVEHHDHENRGMSASRNLGIRESTGSLVALLDADDVWLRQKLAEQVALFEANPEAGMVCGASEYWRSWAREPADGNEDVIVPVGAPQPGLVQPPELLRLLYPLGTGAAPCPSTLMLRRGAIEKVGGFEETFRGDLQLYEDQAFLAKIYLQTGVYVASACWNRYRQRADSCVATVKGGGRYHTVRQFYLCWLERYLCERGVEDTATWTLLQRALRPYRQPVLDRLLRLVRSAAQTSRSRGRRLMRWALSRLGLR